MIQLCWFPLCWSASLQIWHNSLLLGSKFTFATSLYLINHGLEPLILNKSWVSVETRLRRRIFIGITALNNTLASQGREELRSKVFLTESGPAKLLQRAVTSSCFPSIPYATGPLLHHQRSVTGMAIVYPIDWESRKSSSSGYHWISFHSAEWDDEA